MIYLFISGKLLVCQADKIPPATTTNEKSACKKVCMSIKTVRW